MRHAACETIVKPTHRCPDLEDRKSGLRSPEARRVEKVSCMGSLTWNVDRQDKERAVGNYEKSRLRGTHPYPGTRVK